MATKKNATKTTRRADINLGGLSNIKVTKKTQKAATKTAKSMGARMIFIFLACLLFGIGLGGGAWWFVCRNDEFTLLGSEEVTRELGIEMYEDEGVKIIAFGRDETDSVQIKTDLIFDEATGKYTANECRTYYIKYSSTCFKYGMLFKIEKVRLVTFVEPSEGGE